MRRRPRRGFESAAALVARQRKEGEGGGLSSRARYRICLFPNADAKIYLDASPEERARRRAADPAHGLSRAAASSEVASEMEARDLSDRTRSTSPLTKARDAVEVDTTLMSIEETVKRVLEIVMQAIGARA